MTASDHARQLALTAANAAAGKKAHQITLLDVSDQLVITDCFVIASAPNERQVQAIVDAVEEQMAAAGSKPVRREGAREGRWVLLDFVDVVVHVQHAEERSFYGLERLWKDCPAIPFEADAPEVDESGVTLNWLVLWRHGETDYNAVQRMQGQLDSQLTATGRSQASQAARWLAALKPEVLMTSDLSRAEDTAAVLAAETGMPLWADRRLRETHLGEWQGLSHPEVEALCPGGLTMWRGNPEWAPPGGETKVEVAARAAHVVAELDAAGHASAVLCTHGGLIAGLTPRLLGLPVSGWSVFGGMSNCHWTVLLRCGSGWRLLSYNTAASV